MHCREFRLRALLLFLLPAWVLLCHAGAQAPGILVHFAFNGNVAQVPLEREGGRIFLPVRVNETAPSAFLLDTGAAQSAMDKGRAIELGLAQPDESQKDPAGIAGAQIGLPGVTIGWPLLPETSLGSRTPPGGRPLQGIIGGDLLSQFVVEIDYQNDAVRFHARDGFTYTGRGAIVPLSFTDGAPCVQARVRVPGRRPFDATFAIATGAGDGLVFTRSFTESHGLLAAHFKTIPSPAANGDDAPLLGRIHEIQLGGYTVEEPLAAFREAKSAEDPWPHTAGAIGGELLERFTVFLDLSRQRIILEPNAHFHEYQETDMSGMILRATGPASKTIEVVSVISSSPAAQAGIQKGDVIAAIDQQYAADLSLADVHQMFRQVGHEYKVSIERGEKTIEYKLRMRPLI